MKAVILSLAFVLMAAGSLCADEVPLLSGGMLHGVKLKGLTDTEVQFANSVGVMTFKRSMFAPEVLERLQAEQRANAGKSPEVLAREARERMETERMKELEQAEKLRLARENALLAERAALMERAARARAEAAARPKVLVPAAWLRNAVFRARVMQAIDGKLLVRRGDDGGFLWLMNAPANVKFAEGVTFTAVVDAASFDTLEYPDAEGVIRSVLCVRLVNVRW